VTAGKRDDDERKERVPRRPGVERILGRTTYSKLRILFATLAVALITVAPPVSAPNPLFPNCDTCHGAPAMGWEKVSGADHC
jgi:hypothetical protein